LKILIVAAWEPELSRFRERWASPSAALPEGLELVVDVLGVGVVESAIAMTRCVARHAPSIALLLGTCGAFAPSPSRSSSSSPSPTPSPIGSVVTPARARLVAGDLVDGTSALPEPMPAEASFDAALLTALVSAGAKSVQIANTLGITVDDALAARLGPSGDVEHLEAFAFARACAVANVPCGAVLGVANMVGARGRAEWLAGHASASANAADVAWAALGAIAQIRTSTTTP
jgi:nucleoside phosphorylase